MKWTSPLLLALLLAAAAGGAAAGTAHVGVLLCQGDAGSDEWARSIRTHMAALNNTGGLTWDAIEERVALSPVAGRAVAPARRLAAAGLYFNLELNSQSSNLKLPHKLAPFL